MRLDGTCRDTELPRDGVALLALFRRFQNFPLSRDEFPDVQGPPLPLRVRLPALTDARGLFQGPGQVGSL